MNICFSAISSLARRRRVLTSGVASLLLALPTVSQAYNLTSAGFTDSVTGVPIVTDWSTLTSAVSISAGDALSISDAAGVLSRMANLNATEINQPFPVPTSTNPPSTNLAARYNSTYGAFQTRATSNSGTVMMTSLFNADASSFSSIRISFDFQQYTPTDGVGNESIPGWMAFFSVTGLPGTWNPIPEFTNVVSTSRLRLEANISTNGWAPGTSGYLLFFDDNADNTNGVDIANTLDNISFVPTIGTAPTSLVWNRSHTVGGAPNGKWEVSEAAYWKLGGNASGFQNGSFVSFSENGDTTITVDANVAPASTSVTHSSGTYTVGGTGSISGALQVSGTGTLVLQSDNGFSNVALGGGGKVVTQHLSALGNGVFNVEMGGITLQTDVDLTLGSGINGAGALTKTGPGILSITGTGTGTGGITINGGTLQATSATALGGANQQLTMGAGTTLEVAGNSTYAGSLTIGGVGVTLRNTNAAQGEAFALSRTDGLTGSGTISKTGPGVVRITAAQNALSSAWLIDQGTLEGNTAPNPFGSGHITVNPNGMVVLGQITIGNAITLAGGTLGIRSGDTSVFNGAVDVTQDSFFALKSNSTPTDSHSGTIGGLLSGAGGLTLVGNVPLTPSSGKSLSITNPGNTYSGKITVTSQQTLRLASVTGTGNPLANGRVTLAGGGLMVLDNGVGDNGTINVGTPITIDAPTDGLLPGTPTINVDRVSGFSVGNTIAFSNVTFAGSRTLATTGANGYKVRLDGVTLQGDPTFQVDTAPLEVAAGLTGGFNVTKTGTGELTLSGNNTYSGITHVNAGSVRLTGALANTPRIDLAAGTSLNVTALAAGLTLGSNQTLAGAGTVSGVVTLGNGASLAPGEVNGLGALSLSNLTFGTTAADTSSVKYNLAGGNFPSVSVTTADALLIQSGNQSISFDFAGPSTTLGRHVLIDYSGAPLTADQFNAFKIGAKSSRLVASLENDVANTAITLNVTAIDFPVWTGARSSEWSNATIADPKNWVLNSNAAVTTDFLPLDSVLFSDSATNRTVNVTEDVAVSSVTFDHSGTYTLGGAGAITGLGGLNKKGAGTLIISNSNTFSGPVVLEGGTVEISTLADGGQASPLGTNNQITFNGGTLSFVGGPTTINRVLNTAGPGTIQITDHLTVSSALAGIGALTKSGPGTLVLTGNSTAFNGGLVVKQGVLEVSGSATNYAELGGNTQSVTLDGGTLSDTGTATTDTIFADAATILRTLSIGAAGGTINVANATHPMVIHGGLSGAAGTKVTKTGPGFLRVYGVNPNLQSDWVIEQGVLDVEATSLGTGSVTVNGGTIAPRNVTFANDVTFNGGVLGSRSGDLTNYTGTINAAAPFVVDLRSSNSFGALIITVSGLLTGNGDITVSGVPANEGTPPQKYLALTNPANTYSGIIQVDPGQILMARPSSPGNPLGTATIRLNDGRLTIWDNGVGNDGLIQYGNNLELAATSNSSRLEVNSATAGPAGNTIVFGGLTIGAQTLNVIGQNGYKAQFDGTSTFTAAPILDVLSADVTFKGPITGSAGFTKTGAGRLVLASNANTFSGPVDVQAGSLILRDANIPAGDNVTIGDATLAGSGSLGGDVTFTGLSAVLSPGETGTAVLSVSRNLTLAFGQVFEVDLDAGVSGPIPGTTYDQVSVGTGGQLSSTGSVQLADANLILRAGAGVENGDIFFILLNDGADPVNGTFPGFAPGEDVDINGQLWRISYSANSADGLTGTMTGGNDVALMAVPEPASALLMLGGLGAILASRRQRPGSRA